MNKKKEPIKILVNNRHFFMGVAMILVVLFHCYCTANYRGLFDLFKYGYIGVDIFLFFSGFGLSFSFCKNSLMQFYRNRITRIIPLYWAWALIQLIVISYSNNILPTFIDIFGLFSTLSYYGIGSIRSNWYLSAAICLYSLFPVIFLMVKKWKWGSVLLILLISIIAQQILPHNHYHNAFIERIYIFLLGIITFQILEGNVSKKFSIYCVSIISIMGLFAISSEELQFFRTAFICPILISILSILPNRLVNSTLISLFGKYSLEIYIGNCWTMLVMDLCDLDTGNKVILYFISNAIFAIVLIYINKGISSIFRHT